MKKQFFRVKQLADQTFSRSGKTEALSEDLLAAEKRVEFLKNTCQNISKRLSSSLLGQGQDTQTKEKRLKKCPEYLLALLLLECSAGEEEDDLLRNILTECSKIQLCLANISAEYDARVEQQVVFPLQQLTENDIYNIVKQKRYLTKFILDMDSAKSRYQAAIKHSNASGSSTNTTKLDAIKEELEDLEMKVEQSRDTLASEMFGIISRETEIANYFLQYMKLQQILHKTALALLDEMLPEIQANIVNSDLKPIFGMALKEHLRLSRRIIAYPIELCICILLELGMEEEGLFRVAGGASKVRRMKVTFDANCMTLDAALEYTDVHVVSSVLKSYLRELPEPLLTYALYEEWILAMNYANVEQKLQMFKSIITRLPKENFNNLRYVLKFLSVVTKHQDVNKMTPQNLAIVIAPNIIWSPTTLNTENIGMNMGVASMHSSIVEILISYADWFFPGDEEFHLTLVQLHVADGHTHTRASSDGQLIDTISPVRSTSDASPIKRSQSTTSLEEQSNLSLGSPKPLIRTRKSKPAPVPPSIPIAQSLQTDHSVKLSTNDEPSTPTSTASPVMQKETISDQFNKGSSWESVNTKLSSNFPCQIEKNVSAGDDTVNLRENQFVPVEYALKNTKISNIRPVPAPRHFIDTVQEGDITMKKPTIPERPASLQRPLSSSFRALRVSDLSESCEKSVHDNDAKKGPSLERAHLYSVNKQQVSIVHVRNPNEEKNESPAKNNDPNNSPTKLKAKSVSINIPGLIDKKDAVMGVATAGVINKPERPPKPDSTEKLAVSSHTRALSDGHNVDTSGGGTFHRNYQRIQRPIPPPPPPPVGGKSKESPCSDSTNL